MPSILTETRLYKIWADMKQRCNNPKNKKYHLYGGRGITIHKDWTSYKNRLFNFEGRLTT